MVLRCWPVKRILALCLLLLTSQASAQTNQFSGAAAGSAPVVNSATFTVSSPVTNGGTVGTATASNSPTGWSIIGGDQSEDFAINNSGVITFTAQGTRNYDGATSLKSATLTLQATNAAGSASGNYTVNVYADGSTQASGGCSPSQPQALSAENVRPPWKVAGIDYMVGVPCNITLKDPGTFTWSGSGVCDVTHPPKLRCDNANGVVVDGYDFACCTVQTVVFVNSTNSVVKNSKFNGANGVFADGGSCGLTIEHVTFDQSAAPDTTTAAITSNCGGNNTFRWNYFLHMSQHVTELNGTSTVTVFNYNFIEQSGTHNPRSHVNYSQFCVNIDAGTTINFNGSYQSAQAAGGTGYQIADGCGSGIKMTSPDVSYNTVYTFGRKPALSYLFYIDGGGSNVTTNGTMTSNYIDDTATLGGPGGGGPIGGGFLHGSPKGWALTGNRNMANGRFIFK
jgi:hypothetical protein